MPVDIVLLLLFGVLCNASVTGAQVHEVLGIAYAALIIVHLFLNRKWIAAALKGKLRGNRSAWMAATNVALLIVFVALLVTGILGSHFLFHSTVEHSETILVVHAALGIVAALLVLVHVLFHTKVIVKRNPARKTALAVVLTLVIGLSIFGAVRGILHFAVPKDGDPKNAPTPTETTRTP